MKSFLLLTLAVLLSLSVPVLGQQTAPVFLVGEVVNPGQYDYKNGMTVQSAITEAGGLTLRADTSTAIVLNADKNSHQVSLNDSNATQTLLPGDTVILRRALSVRIEGKVKKPGAYDRIQGMTILQAYAAAGGALDGANLVDCCLDRKGKLTPINLRAILDGDDLSGNIDIQPGDLIYVPDSVVVVMGSVIAPGHFTLVEGKEMRLKDMIVTAGGFAPNADMKRATLSRIEGSKRKKIDIDLALADSANNPVVQRGDVIEVPAIAAATVRKPFINLTDLQTVALTMYYLSLVNK